MIELFLPITAAACIIGVVVFLACNKQPQPKKEMSGDEWYKQYKESCIVPEWMEKLNEFPLNVGDRILCIRYGLYGITGTVKSIVCYPVMHYSEYKQQKQAGLYIQWDSDSNILPDYINRTHAIRIESAKKKSKKK